MLLSMEWGEQRRRGFMASWPQIGVPIGLMLSTGMLRLFSTVSGAGFDSWGWRVPFLASLVLVAIGLYIRLRILETPLFAEVIVQKKVEAAPVMEVVRRYPKEIILSAFVRVSEQAPFYLFTSFVLAYVTSEVGFSENFALDAVLGAAGLSLFVVPLSGHLSDRIGRKRVYMLGSALTGAWIFPYFLGLNSGIAAWAALVIVLSLIPHDLQYGPQAALIAESFATRLRYSGAGLGYQLASVIAGGPAPLIATYLLHTFGTAWAIAGYVVLCSLVTLGACVLLPDRSHIDIADDLAYENEAIVRGEARPATS